MSAHVLCAEHKSCHHWRHHTIDNYTWAAIPNDTNIINEDAGLSGAHVILKFEKWFKLDLDILQDCQSLQAALPIEV